MKKSLKLITLALSATPLVAVVSCASVDEEKIVLATDSSSYVENNMDLIPGKILLPGNPAENGGSLNIKKFDHYDEHEGNVDLTNGGLKIYFDDIQDTDLTDGIYHADSKEKADEIFIKMNEQIFIKTHEAHQDFLVRNTNLKTNKTQFDYYLNFLRYQIEFDDATKSLTFKIIEIPREGTEMALWIEDVVLDENVGIKSVPRDQVQGGFQYFAGGGPLYTWTLRDQYHLNQNYASMAVGDYDSNFYSNWHAKLETPSYAYRTTSKPADPNDPTAEHWDMGDEIIEPSFKNHGISMFSADPSFDPVTSVYDVKVQTKSVLDLEQHKLFVEFSFYKGGTWVKNSNFETPHVEDSPVRDNEGNLLHNSQGEVINLPGGPITERIVRTVELVGAFPEGKVNQDNWELDKTKFVNTFSLAFKLFDKMKTPMLMFMSKSEDLNKYSEFVEQITDLYEAHKSYFNWDGTEEIPEIYHQMYLNICQSPNSDIDSVYSFYDQYKDLNLDGLLASWMTLLPDFVRMTETPQEQGILLNMIMSVLDNKETIINYPY